MDTTKDRVRRLIKLLSRCGTSIHDLSYVRLDPKARLPRFNMPFELGLAVAASNQKRPKHSFYVLEEKPYRIQTSLSDLNGCEVFIHDFEPNGVWRSLSSIFSTSRRRNMPKSADFHKLFELLQSQLTLLLDGKDLFSKQGYQQVVLAAVTIANEQRAQHR